VDAVKIFVSGGAGGAGHPRYGGIGGKGGSIYAQGKPKAQLMQLKTKERSYKAGVGMPAQKFVLKGNPGEDKTVVVPLGTICETETGMIIGEVNKPTDKVLVAQGGDGGEPSNGFLGQAGQSRNVRMVLKTIADVGFLGFPNAGKSTLLRAISRARPKVANYPFTTLRPHVGVISYPDNRQISCADLPGIIEGAWANKGLGHTFLRHIERTRMLMVVIDIHGFKLGSKYTFRTAAETLLLLNKELELYDPLMLSKPALLVLNKMDLETSPDRMGEFEEALAKGKDLLLDYPREMRPQQRFDIKHMVGISAKHNSESIECVKETVRHMLDNLDHADDALPMSSFDNQQLDKEELGPRMV